MCLTALILCLACFLMVFSLSLSSEGPFDPFLDTRLPPEERKVRVKRQSFGNCKRRWTITHGATCRVAAKACETDLAALLKLNPVLGKEGGGCKLLVDGQQLCCSIPVPEFGM